MNPDRASAPPSCDYCGLPVLAATTRPAVSSPLYCCLGCKLAAAVMREREGGESGSSTLTRLGLGVFFAMNVMVFTLVLWTWDVYSIESAHRTELLRELFRYACMLFAVPVLLLLGGPLLESALGDLRQKRISTDALLSLGVLAAYAYSFVSIVRGGQHVYFEVGSMILVAVTLGRWLEASGKQQATRGLQSLQKLIPETVRLATDEGEKIVPTDVVFCGQIARVMPGERIPLDGDLLSERAEVDQQIITGESDPVVKFRGQRLYGGSVNGNTELRIEVSSAAHEGTVHRMIDAVQQAALSKNRYQRLADRVASWFVPTVTSLALVVFAWHTANHSFQQGLLASLSILLIACPCAMGIATPLAAWTSLAEAARHGVLFRHGDALLQLAKADTFLLDKTGTLTTGQMVSDAPLKLQVDDSPDSDEPRWNVEEVAISLARASRHPLCEALADHRRAALSAVPLECIESVPGRGMKAQLPCGAAVALGDPAFVAQVVGAPPPAEYPALRATGATPQNSGFAVGWDRKLRAYYLIREQLRPGGQAALDALRQRGLHVAILTGDRTERAHQLQGDLNVDVRGQLLPDDKLAQVRQQQALGHRVVFVGDGVNDAPALAAADVGIAMSCGADVTREAASVCLLGNELMSLPRIHELAQATTRTIRNNLIWSFAYNLVGIGFAVTGRLNPILAAAAMVASSLIVITNSLRLAPRARGLWQSRQGAERLADATGTSAMQRPRTITSGATT